MNTPLILRQNLDDFAAFYGMLDASNAGLDRDERHMLNAQLVLLLANHIGDLPVLRQAFAMARVKVELIQSNLAADAAASAAPPPPTSRDSAP